MVGLLHWEHTVLDHFRGILYWIGVNMVSSNACHAMPAQCLRSASTCQSKQNTTIIWRMEHPTNSITALKQVFPLQQSVPFLKEHMYSLLELFTSLSSSSVEVRDNQQIQSRVRISWHSLQISGVPKQHQQVFVCLTFSYQTYIHHLWSRWPDQTRFRMFAF